MGFSGDDKGKFLSAQFGIVIHQISLKMAWSIEMQIKTNINQALGVLF